MFCDAYNKSLTQAAAAERELTPALQQHLFTCESCRTAFAEEQSLFTAIDSSLHTVANPEIPATLIPRIHVALNNMPVSESNLSKWTSTGALIAAALVLFITLNLKDRKFQNSTENVNDQASTQVSVSRSGHSFPPHAESVERVPSRKTSAIHPHTAPVAMTANLPEVLLAPGQRETTERFVQAMRNEQFRDELLAKKGSKEAVLEALAMKPIKIEPLAPVSSTGD
ncbi:MAG: hypothetical protein JSS69_05450 [Acidobacteria bacterium]|nr:hypothetical protein [Acidobacteriota bacterium]